MGHSGREIPERRNPKQRRSQETVRFVLDAAVRILIRDGVNAVTTNRIAEVAGVSVGSIYQYFPDKHAIFVALHERHVAEVGEVVEQSAVKHIGASSADLWSALIGAMVDMHLPSPSLQRVWDAGVPHEPGAVLAFEERIQAALRPAIEAKDLGMQAEAKTEQVLCICVQMLNALAHGVLRRPSHVSLSDAKQEAARALNAYWNEFAVAESLR
jgi:AcrR family transcriptional regulator